MDIFEQVAAKSTPPQVGDIFDQVAAKTAPAPTGAQIGPTPPRGAVDRLLDVFRQGSLASLFQTQGNPDLAALDKNFVPAMERPLVQPSAAMDGTDPKTMLEGAEKGLLEGLDTFASPQGVAMLGSFGKLGKAGPVGKAAVKAIGAGFDVDMIASAIQEVPEAKVLWDAGNQPEAARVAVRAALSLGLGASGAAHKIRERVGPRANTAGTPAAPARGEVIQREAAAGAAVKDSLTTRTSKESLQVQPPPKPDVFDQLAPEVQAAAKSAELRSRVQGRVSEVGGRFGLTDIAEPLEITPAEARKALDDLTEQGLLLRQMVGKRPIYSKARGEVAAETKPVVDETDQPNAETVQPNGETNQPVSETVDQLGERAAEVVQPTRPTLTQQAAFRMRGSDLEAAAKAGDAVAQAEVQRRAAKRAGEPSNVLSKREVAPKTATPTAKPVSEMPVKTEPKAATPELGAGMAKLQAAVSKGVAEKLRAGAEGLTRQIEAKKNPGIANQNPTARRNRIAGSMMREGERLERIQTGLRKLADLHEGGAVPEVLKGVKSRGVIESIMTRVDSESGKEYEPTFPKGTWDPEARKRLQAAGITEQNFAKAVQAFKDLGAKPAADTPERRVAKMERDLVGKKYPGFFQTPKAAAEGLADWIGIEKGMTVLDPEAGAGRLADAARARGAEPRTIEPVGELRAILEAKGYEVAGSNFLEHAGQYDRIIMNPPFENGADMEHVRHAYDQLKPGGKLGAIMGEGGFFRSDKKATAFREWFESVGGVSEKLPEGTFKESGTGVASRRVKIEKPKAAKVLQKGTDNISTPSKTPVTGRETTVAIPGEDTRYKARYAVRELEDVQASHNEQSFEPNPKYAHQNDRDYKQPGNAARVIDNAQKFDPEFLLTDSPTAEQGATIVDAAGNALGGNNRRMTLGRVYEHNPEAAKQYRERLQQKAAEFGLDPEAVKQFKRPVLVRERVGDITDAQKEITDYNKTAAAKLNPGEQAVTDGRRMSDRTLSRIVGQLEDAGESGSLADALRGDNGAEVINGLVKDGILTEQEKNAYVDERDQLTADAKGRIAKALVGRMFESAEQWNNTPPELRNKLERIAPHVARVESRAGWKITEQVREALSVAEEMRARGINADDLANQPNLDGTVRKIAPDIRALATTLREGPVKAAAAFRRYANDEALSREGAQKPMFEPPTQKQAFEDAFGRKERPNAQAMRFPDDEPKVSLFNLKKGFPTKDHARLAYVAPIELTEHEGRHAVAVVADAHAIEVLARTMGMERGSAASIGGMNLSHGNVRSLANSLYEHVEVPRLQPLFDALRQAIRERKGLVVISSEPRFREMRNAIVGEEFAHAQQAAVTGYHADLFNNPSKLFNSPIFREAALALKKRGYKFGSHKEAAVEVTVRLMYPEGVKDLGLSPDDARELAARYIRSLRDGHGSKKPREIASEVFRAFRKPARESGGAVGSPAKGRIDLPGGARQDVSGEQSASEPSGRNGERDSSVGDPRNAPQIEVGEQPNDKAKLLGDQLTAGFNAPLTPDEKLAKLKPRKTEQRGLFGGDEGAQQDGLFGTDDKGNFVAWLDRKPNLLDAINPKNIARRLNKSLLKDAVEFFQPLGYRLEKQGGGAGAELRGALRRANDNGEVMAGKRLLRLADSGISKLTKPQRFALLDRLEGRTKAGTDAAVEQAFNATRALTDDIAGDAEALDVMVRTAQGRVPFEPMTDYYPHLIRGPEALKSGPVRADVIENLGRLEIQPNKAKATEMVDAWIDFAEGREAEKLNTILEHMVKTGQAPDTATAFAKLKKFRAHVNRHGNIEFAREVNLPFYDPDPARVMPTHVAGATMRLAQVSELGQDNQIVNREVLKIAEAGGNADFARKAVDRIAGWVDRADDLEAKLSRAARAFQGLRLGLSAIPNSTQGVLNGLLGADFPSLAAGLKAAMSKPGARLAAESGATIDPILHESVRELATGNRVLERYLKAVGFTATERFNRVLAANTGAAYAGRMLTRARMGDKRAVRVLGELGVEVAKGQTKLTADQTLMAAKKFSDASQFRARPEDMPEFASTEIGKVFFQFKSFAYNQARFLDHATRQEVADGNYGRAFRNVLILATLFPAAGEGVIAARNAITGRERREREAWERYLNDLAAAGSLGILADLIQSGRSRRLLETMAGPTVTDAARLGEAALGKNPSKDVKKWLEGRTPLVQVVTRGR